MHVLTFAPFVRIPGNIVGHPVSADIAKVHPSDTGGDGEQLWVLSAAPSPWAGSNLITSARTDVMEAAFVEAEQMPNLTRRARDMELKRGELTQRMEAYRNGRGEPVPVSEQIAAREEEVSVYTELEAFYAEGGDASAAEMCRIIRTQLLAMTAELESK